MKREKYCCLQNTIGLLLTLIVLVAPVALQAQESQLPEKNWEFNLAPLYLWGASMSGDMVAMGNGQQVDVDFGTIADSLEGVVTVHFEGMHKSGWGFLTDLSYLNLSGEQTLPGPFPTMQADITNTLAEAAGLYRFDYGASAVDVLGGVRYYGVESEINVVGNPPQVNMDKDWVDAMFGGRYIWQFAKKWSFVGRGDFAFGGSDLTWHFSAVANYQPWKHASFLFGYRYMDIDYSDGSGASLFKYDVTMHGPLVALNFVW